MTDDDPDGDASVPDSDSRHIDPSGSLADAVESGDLELELDEEQGVDELREFLERVEAGEFDADPGLGATVRIVRSLLDGIEK